MKPQGWIGLIGVVLACGAITWFGILRSPRPLFVPAQQPAGAPSAVVPPAAPAPSPTPASAPPPAQTSAAPAPTPASSSSAEISPSFDVVRVEPDGSTVVAGRAKPGAKVTLLRDGAAIAETTASQDGQWALVPPPLPKGAVELSLRATYKGREAGSKQAVTVNVPAEKTEEVIVVLKEPGAPAKVLAQPGAAKPMPQAAPATSPPATPSASPSPPRMARRNARITTVEVDAAEGLFVSGTAEPGAKIQIYLNNALIASVTAASDGGFGLRVEKGVSAGRYQIRVDDVDGEGKVLTRAEVPFVKEQADAAVKDGTVKDGAAEDRANAPKDEVAAQMPSQVPPAPSPVPPAVTPPPKPDPSVAVVPQIRTLTVVRGDSLWRISHKLYGKGIRYTVIYDANTDQIRNPDLIYPNQILVVPPK